MILLQRLLLLASTWLLLLLASSTTFFSVFADAKKSDAVKIKATKVDSEPVNLFYFDDSDVVLFQEIESGDVHISRDAGESWDLVQGPKGKIKGHGWSLFPHPYDNQKAYILGKGEHHWVTDDQAKTWREFKLDGQLTPRRSPLVFHGRDSNKVIIQAEICLAFLCAPRTFYTTNDFKEIKPLGEDLLECKWAVATDTFGDGVSDIDNRILCIAPGLHSSWSTDNRFLYSDKLFEDGGIEIPLNSGRAVAGAIHIAPAQNHLVVATKSARTKELALYITADAKNWHRAMFDGHKLEEDEYTLLASTNYTVRVGVLSKPHAVPMGDLYSSNSNGTYFTRNVEHLNRNAQGYFDYESIEGIDGIALANVVDNWKELDQSHDARKKIVSRITFDDGRTFRPLKAGKEDLHLHSITDKSNIGPVFSSPAPGLLMGVGNTGDQLKEYLDGDLYVSDDAGISWRKARSEAHKYEFGDQGSVLVAVFDEGRTDEVYYSINHGKDWSTAKLPENIRPSQFTTNPDSTSLKFLLVGSTRKESKTEHYIISLDFRELHERKCGDKDFERWPARLDEKGEPDCLMGHKQFYRRRKADADCFIDEEFKDPVPEFEPCKCTKEDFECDFNYVKSEDGQGCVPSGVVPVPEKSCKKPDDTYEDTAGFRLIPGNKCIRQGGEELDKQTVKRSCKDTHKGPTNGEIAVEKTFFTAEKFASFYYLERSESSSGNDETVVALTAQQNVFLSRDHGKSWKEILSNKDIVKIVPHKYFDDIVYFLTLGKDVYYSIDRGDTIHHMQVDLPINRDGLPPLTFHPNHRDWLIWTGADECNAGGDCHSTALYTTNRGAEWHLLMRYVRRCEFLGREGRDGSDKLVLCGQFENENPSTKHVKLVSSDDWFASPKEHFGNILDFATMSEFIIVAARAEDQKMLKIDASVDGRTFAEAEFPPNFQVPYGREYTALDSSTHAVFLHVTVSTLEGHEYGSIIKSNSNGTSYVLSLSGVNRNEAGYVDFEKMKGLEGVALVNVVGNVNEVEKGSPKQLKSKITHNDGAEWSLLAPPERDAEGRSFGCSVSPGKGTNDCALHLHGYTERRDPRDTYGSQSAIGLMMGVGNVGDHLTLKSEADTFITRDGGITWHSVKKGNYMWEYGDQGSVIVIVPDSKPTKTLFYSLDEGDSWKEHKFTQVDMYISDISTVPSDTSRKFLLWGKEVGSGARPGVAAVHLDFSGLKERQRRCTLREEAPEADDYYLWEPKHPSQDNNCLFGHVSRYHRKRPEAQCYNDRSIQHLDHVGDNCQCTRQDYEWYDFSPPPIFFLFILFLFFKYSSLLYLAVIYSDTLYSDYNYEPDNSGSCRLVPGLQPEDPKKVCTDDTNAVEYYEPTGYRRIPITTCTGGLQLNHIVAHPCPNKEEEFEKKHPGLTGAGLFFAIVIPVSLAGFVGYYAFTRWDGKFGRIRLGDVGSSSISGSNGGLFDRDSPLVSIPVTIVAGTVAVITAIPLLMSSLWRSAKGYIPILGGGGGSGTPRPYSSRGAFAARRGDFAGVVDDEDELLGSDDGEDDAEV